LFIAVKGGRVEHLNMAFSMIALHCNDRGYSFPKLSDCSIYEKHVCLAFYAPPCTSVTVPFMHELWVFEKFQKQMCCRVSKAYATFFSQI